MGGNTRAIDRQTGELKNFAGRDAYADKADFRNLNRAIFKKHFIAVFKELDNEHNRMFGEPIWDPRQRNSILMSGEAFNGSSEHLFGDIKDEEFIKYKPLVGDVDLTVPEEKLKTIFELLSSLEEQKITSQVTYIGQNRSRLQGEQINALFAYQPTLDVEPIFIQIDFEGVVYEENGRPEEFSKFGHSSSWNDIKIGIKGVFHKYILRSLASIVSTRQNVVLLTPTSPLSPPEKIKVKKTTSPAQLLSFSVAYGLRTNATQQFLPNGEPLIVGDKLAFKEIPTSESNYERSKSSIYTLLFGVEPEENDLTLFDSYVGILELLNKNLNDSQIENVFLDMVQDKFFGKSQRLDATNPEIDRQAKMVAISKFIEIFPFVKKHENLIKNLSTDYYASYKIRESLFDSIRDLIIEYLRQKNHNF